MAKKTRLSLTAEALVRDLHSGTSLDEMRRANSKWDAEVKKAASGWARAFAKRFAKATRDAVHYHSKSLESAGSDN